MQGQEQLYVANENPFVIHRITFHPLISLNCQLRVMVLVTNVSLKLKVKVPSIPVLPVMCPVLYRP